jgi:hypothetical protein
MPDDLVLAEHPAGRATRDPQDEGAGAEERHACLVVSPQPIGLAGLDGTVTVTDRVGNGEPRAV